MASKDEIARRAYAQMSTAATDADGDLQLSKLARLIAHAQATGAAKVLVALDVVGARDARDSHHQATVSLREQIEIDLATVELEAALLEKRMRPEVSPGLTGQRATALPPVADHEAEGDGTADPTWCYCGRSFSDHLRRPR